VFTHYFFWIGIPLVVLTYMVFLLRLEKSQEEAPVGVLWAGYVNSAVSGILFTYLLFGILIDALHVFNVVFNVDSTFLGLSVLVFVCCFREFDAVSKMVENELSEDSEVLLSTFFGQLFAFLVGWVFLEMRLQLDNREQSFTATWSARGTEGAISLLTVFLVLGGVLALFCVLRFMEVGKRAGWALVVAYWAFMGAIGLLTVVNAIGGK
jgi:hypothetical protein